MRVMAELWDRAVAEAAEEPPGSLDEAARLELVNLWTDLEHEMSYAYNGEWSVGCDGRVKRIINLSRHLGATPWEQVPVSLLTDRVYQRIMTAAGIQFAAPSEEDLRKIADWVSRQKAYARGHGVQATATRE